MKIAKLGRPLVILLAVAALLAVGVTPVMAQPVTSPFSGVVTIDDDPAPDGSEVAAYVGDETESRGTTTTTGGTYELMIFGSAVDVGQEVSFKVKKAGTEEWLEAITDPVAPTYASYDPQVVNLSALTISSAPITVTWITPRDHTMLIAPYPANARPFLTVAVDLSEVTSDADWFQIYWLDEATGDYLYFISGYAGTLTQLEPDEFYLVVVSSPTELIIPQ